MHAPTPVPSNLLLHMYTNWRDPPSICRARSPFIILTTRDHYRGFKALFRHFNSVLSPCHCVWDTLRDGVQAKRRTWKLVLPIMPGKFLRCWMHAIKYCNQDEEQRSSNLKGNPSPLDLLVNGELFSDIRQQRAGLGERREQWWKTYSEIDNLP